MTWVAGSPTVGGVKAVVLDMPQAVLDERRRRGLDGRDEVWDGVLHVVPPPGEAHQALAADLFVVLASLAEARGLVARFETGLFRTADDYRVPDQLVRRPEAGSARGAESAELVVEILSEHDETTEKIAWYAALGVRELLVVDPHDRRVQLLRADQGHLVAVEVGPEGVVSEVLGARFETGDGRLAITHDAGRVEL